VLLDVRHYVGRGSARLSSSALGVELAVVVCARGFVTGADVNVVFEEFGVALLDGAAVNHDEGAVVAGSCNDCAGHVFIAAWDGDVGVMVLATGYGFDAVSDNFASLKRETHA